MARGRHLSAAAWWAILTVVVMTGGAGAASDQNPMDVSSYARQVAELRIPTLVSVRKASTEALQLFDEGQYDEAVEALDR
ncbi:MAG: hypothetical protein IMX02_10245 [Limnochordaceae bacterium]|nr:hypothetical protein [Limnochordaceae bacterium]